MSIEEEATGDFIKPYKAVVSLCEEFSRAQITADPPSIESYLARVTEEPRVPLLRNLLELEIENKRSRGIRVQMDDYLARFPEYSTLIREVFLEAVARSSSFSVETAQPMVARARLPMNTRLGAYQLVGLLGEGGMGMVYEAVHGPTSNRVALKTLPVLTGAGLHRFKREFRALAGVNHPNLIGLQQLEADGGQWFFTMDLIEGDSFLQYVRPDGVLDEARLRSTLGQLVTGVMALHAQNTIHRDLKPNNVMVTRDGRVVVLDFGLVLEIDPSASMSRSVVGVAGTPRYMAPEQGVAGKVTGASDWYAVGVMLYEALSGKAPFSGSMQKIIQDKNSLEAPPIPGNVPADLAELCMRLLARRPDDRPDAREIVKVIAANAAPVATTTTTTTNQPLIGRETQLAALQDAYQQFLKERTPLTVFIRGLSGEGKSALADRFFSGVRAEKRVVLMSGRCYDRESVPFKALDSLIDALTGYLLARPHEDALRLIPDDINMLVQVFPVLQRVPVIAEATETKISGMDETQIRQRAFRALRSLLSRLGRRIPIIWFVDDLQWGDADSAEALFEILRPPEAPTLMFVSTYRSDETEGSAFLGKWKTLQMLNAIDFADREVTVGPLNEAQGVEMVVNVVGRDNKAIRDRATDFVRETQGNAFLLTELAGCFDPESDSFESIPLHEVLARKLERLPAEAGSLLNIICVSGQALDLGEAARTIGFDQPPMATITRMRNERLIRLLGDDETPKVDTYHDRVRETVLRKMKDPDRAALHRRFAELIECEAGVNADHLENEFRRDEIQKDQKSIRRIYDLAYHFDQAGEQRKGWVYAISGAEQALRQSALEVALNNYALARRNVSPYDRNFRYRIAAGSSQAMLRLGRYSEAELELKAGFEVADDDFKKSKIELRFGNLMFNRGDLHNAASYYEGSLRRLGKWVPRSSLGLFIGILGQLIIQIIHSLFPGRLHRGEASATDELSLELLCRNAKLISFASTIRFVWSSLAILNLAERFIPGQGLSVASAAHGILTSMLGWQSRGNRYFNSAILIAQKLNDDWLLGLVSSYRGIGFVASARYPEGIEAVQNAIQLFSKAGDHWEVNLANFHESYCHFGLGDLAKATNTAKNAFASSARFGDSRVFCTSYLWARATRGNFPFESLQVCFPNRPDDVMSTVHGIMAEGHWHSFHGRTAEALAIFERAAKRVRETGCVNSHMIVTVPELAKALRLHADTVAVTDQKAAWKLRKRAWKVGKWALRFGFLFPAIRPHAWRERALILDAYGKTKKALKAATKSCAIAESQKAKYEHAQSLLVCGQLAKKLGHADAEETIRRAETAIEEMERPVREMNAVGGRGK